MNVFACRTLREADVQELLAIGSPSGEKRRRDKILACLALDHWSGIVALSENQHPIGFLIYEHLGKNSFYIVQINAAIKRAKIGTKLFSALRDEVPVHAHLSLCVNTDNLTAIAFYETLGFAFAGYTKGYREDEDKFWYTCNADALQLKC